MRRRGHHLGRSLTLPALLLALFVAASCEREAEEPPQAPAVRLESSSLAKAPRDTSRSPGDLEALESAPTAAQPAPGFEPAASCAELESRAAGDDADAALLVALCPDRPLPRSSLRAALLRVSSPAGAAQLAPVLAGHPELWGLAQLAAAGRGPAPIRGELEDAGTTAVNPITAEVLADVDLAHRLLRAPSEPAANRTRAHLYLARVHFQGLLSLGLDPEAALPPFARLLAGRALYHGRQASLEYWQRRVSGLARPVRATEADLRKWVSHLARTPHQADDALLAVERQRSLDHVLLPGVLDRTTGQLAEAGTSIDAFPIEPARARLVRLLDHGFVDLATERALARSSDEDGPDFATTAALLDEELKLRGLRAEAARLARELETTDAREPQDVAVLPPPFDPPWRGPDEIANEARRWLEVAPSAGLGRDHATGRALLLLADRPDAVHALLDQELDPAILDAHGAWLLGLLEDQEGPSRRLLHLRAMRMPSSDPDAVARRRFATRFASQDLPDG